jgi:ABC-type antimicrobial peptide transport system permease subunit
MKRVATSQEYLKAFRELSQQRVRGVVVSVQSMYETASMIIQLEFALFLITFIAGVVLFLVILIGVINTLRMTIKERTREIGTVRAIGMQKSDVLRIFLLETGFLAFFASLTGAALAFLAMWGLSSIPINAGDNPMSMLLVNGRLFFAPTAAATAGYILFIVGIAVTTAFFPSRRASRLSAVNAMRHYE